MKDKTLVEISFSLYGDQIKYSYGLLENIRLIPLFYPDSVTIINIPYNHPIKPTLLNYSADGYRLIVYENPYLPGSGGMFWRLIPAFRTPNPELQWFYQIDSNNCTIIRDADSRVNDRERWCYDQWLRSGKALHVIKDHPAHFNIPILGGAWGLNRSAMTDAHLRFLREQLANWRHNYKYGDDEAFLAQHVWERFRERNDYCIHYNPEHRHEWHDPYTYPIPTYLSDPYSRNGNFICEPIKPDPNFLHTLNPKLRPLGREVSCPCFVISPAKYATRLDRFKASYKTSEFLQTCELTVLQGTDTKDLVLPPEWQRDGMYPHYYAVTLDHIKLIRECIEKQYEQVIIFEDDARIRPDFDEFFARMLLALPKNAHGAMLGGQSWSDKYRVWPEDPTKNEYLAKVRGCMGTHAVFYRRSGLIRMLEHLNYWKHEIVDVAFAELQKIDHNWYAPARWIVDIDPEAKQYGEDQDGNSDI